MWSLLKGRGLIAPIGIAAAVAAVFWAGTQWEKRSDQLKGLERQIETNERIDDALSSDCGTPDECLREFVGK